MSRTIGLLPLFFFVIHTIGLLYQVLRYFAFTPTTTVLLATTVLEPTTTSLLLYYY